MRASTPLDASSRRLGVGRSALASAQDTSQHSNDPSAGPNPSRAKGDTRHRTLFLKRLFDVAGAVLGLIIFSPALILVMFWITAVDGGDPIFRQQRLGLRGRFFVIYKFRTVRTQYCDPTGRTIFGQEDARLLPLGSFLRASRLDELPQLVNILRGDMSLVGPRPHVPHMCVDGQDYGSLVPLYYRRTEMVPGLTGWAQCNGLNGPVRTQEEALARLDHDLVYLQSFSIGFDLKIMARTVFHVLAAFRQ